MKEVEVGMAPSILRRMPLRKSQTVRDLLYELDHLGSTSRTDSAYHVASFGGLLSRHAVIWDGLLLLAFDTEHFHHQHAPPLNTFGVYPISYP